MWGAPSMGHVFRLLCARIAKIYLRTTVLVVATGALLCQSHRSSVIYTAVRLLPVRRLAMLLIGLISVIHAHHVYAARATAPFGVAFSCGTK